VKLVLNNNEDAKSYFLKTPDTSKKIKRLFSVLLDYNKHLKQMLRNNFEALSDQS